MLEILDSIWREIRRWYYFNFNMNYVEQSIAKRKGKCSMCSCCDNQIKLLKCKHSKGKICEVWDTEKMPLRCKLYPFDEKDKAKFARSYCTFRWD